MTVPDDREMDAVLAAMLAPPERPGDRGFAIEVERLIDAQAAYARARRRFWRSSSDRFFLWFAMSFAIQGVHRLYAVLRDQGGEDSPLHYLIRLLAYGLILWAILEKNLPQKDKGR